MKKLLILVFALLLCLMATSAVAEEYEYGPSDTDPIVIDKEGEHTVVLKGVTINATNSPAMQIKSPATKVTIVLQDGTTNTLTGSDGFAGIANNGLELVIRCDGVGEDNHECDDNCGKLTANSGYQAAGIGSDAGGNFSGRVTITGGNVAANGDFDGAGIGAGSNGDFVGTVSITGGNVTANSNVYGACIGSGFLGAFNGSVVISDGSITMDGGMGGAGIGSGSVGLFDGSITITGGDIVFSGCGTGIGSDGDFSKNGTVTIADANVTAVDSDSGVGIGSSGNFDGNITITGSSISGSGVGSAFRSFSGTVTITNSTVSASSSMGAGIGSGMEGDMSGTVTITDSTVTANSGSGAGIGAGYGGDFTGKLIMRGKVDVTAIGYDWGIGPGHSGPISEGAEIYVEPTNGNVIGVKQGYNEDSAVNLAGTPYANKTLLNDLLNGSRYVRTRYNVAAPVVDYTVTAQTEKGGNVSANPENGEEGTEVTLTATPGEGYRFVRWEVVSGGVTITDNKFTIGTSDVVVNGIFEKLTYPITWNNYDGTVLEEDAAVPYGETPSYDGETPVKPDDAQYTYTFTGWSPAVSSVTKEANYIAQFTATLNTYAITWKNYDGTVLEVDETVNYGIIPIYNGATPTRPADNKYTYTFKGWSPAVAAASADCEYIAVYEMVVPDVPKTGDNMNFVLIAALAAVGMIGMTVILRKKKES